MQNRSRTLAAYSYAANNGLLQQMSYGNGATVEYAYDELERVTDVYYNGSDGKLSAMTSPAGSFRYTYDSVGNIRSVSEGGTTHTYTYGDAEWKDLLTAYDGRTFTWADGRRLASVTGSGTSISYSYNADGLRLTKSINGTLHRYTWQGSRLISEHRAGSTLEFFYDESGRPAAFSHNGTLYTYVTRKTIIISCC